MIGHPLVQLDRRVGWSPRRWLASLLWLALGMAALAWLVTVWLHAPRAIDPSGILRDPAFLRGWALAQTVVVLLAAPLLTLDLFSRQNRQGNLQKLFLSGWSSAELVVTRSVRPLLLAAGWTAMLGLPGWLVAFRLGTPEMLGWLAVQLELLTVALLAGSLGLLGSILFHRVSTAAAAAYALVLVMMLGPLLLGPLVAGRGEIQGLIEGVLLASPLASVSSALDFDLLRTEILYRISPLGQRRFDYPDWWSASALYVTTAMICMTISIWSFSTRRRGSRT